MSRLALCLMLAMLVTARRFCEGCIEDFKDADTALGSVLRKEMMSRLSFAPVFVGIHLDTLVFIFWMLYPAGSEALPSPVA